jgi:hypothetical protein
MLKPALIVKTRKVGSAAHGVLAQPLEEVPFLQGKKAMEQGDFEDTEIDFMAGEYEGAGPWYRSSRFWDVRTRKARGCDLNFRRLSSFCPQLRPVTYRYLSPTSLFTLIGPASRSFPI